MSSLQRLRIAILTSVPYPPQEGIGVHSHELAKRLIAAGHDATIFTRGAYPITRTESVEGVPVVRIRFLPLYPFHVDIHGYFVRKHLISRVDDIDLVHAHTPLPPVPPRLWPLVTTLHSSLGDDAHATEVRDAMSLLIKLQTPFSTRIERRLLSRSQLVTVVNPSMTDRATELSRNVPIKVVTNAVDTDVFHPGAMRSNTRTVLSVGRLAPGKGVEDLLTAWPTVLADHRDAKLRIIGGGPSAMGLKRQASRLGLASSVHFVGPLGRDNRAQLSAAYREAWVVVQPSHHENLSTVVLEGMASGAAVVATRVGAHPRVIDHGKDGVLVSPRDPIALGKSVSRLLSNPDAVDRLGARARRKMESAYSWDSLVQSYLNCYRQAIDSA